MRITATMALLLAFGLWTGVPSDARGQDAYKDPKYGFSVATVDGWDPIPAQPTERNVVAKWTAPREIRDLPAQMLVLVFEKRRPPPAADPAAGENPAGGYERTGGGPGDPHGSYAAWAKLDRTRSTMGLTNGKPFKAKAPRDGQFPGVVYETSRDSGYRRGNEPVGNYYVVVAVVDTPDAEYAVELFVSDKEQRKYRPEFLNVAKSFALLEKAAPAEKPAAGELSPREEARRVARENATRVAGWWYEETDNYFVVSNVPRKKQAFISELKTRLEAIRRHYEKDFPPPKPIDAVSIVRVCDDRQTYTDYGGPGGTGGYWNFVAKELVIFAEGEKNNTWATLNHEAFHQYIFYACGEIHPHTWFNEGYGDYYAGAKIVGSKVTEIGPFRWREDTIKSAIRAATHVPWKEILRYTQGQYYGRAELCYAQGWSMVYFLRQGLAPDHPWAKILPTYLKVLQESQSAAKALDEAFKDVDLDKIEAAWGEFIVKGKKAGK